MYSGYSNMRLAWTFVWQNWVGFQGSIGQEHQWWKVANQAQKMHCLQIKIDSSHIMLWQEWVIDAERCCRDRVAGGRGTLKWNDWLLLWCFCLTYLWRLVTSSQPLCDDSCNDLKHFIRHIEQLSDMVEWEQHFYVPNLHARFVPVRLSIKREVTALHLSKALKL